MTTLVLPVTDYFPDETAGFSPAAFRLQRYKHLLIRRQDVQGASGPTESLTQVLATSQSEEQRQEGFRVYLDGLLDEIETRQSCGFSRDVILQTWIAWERIRDHFLQNGKQLAVPNACPGENDNVTMVWSRGDYYLECEVFGDGRREYFFRHRRSGENCDADLAPGEEEGEDVHALLSLFAF